MASFPLTPDPSSEPESESVLFSGTPDQIATRLAQLDPAFSQFPPNTICQFIKTNPHQLRNAGIEAIVEGEGPDAVITLRSLALSTPILVDNSHQPPPPQADDFTNDLMLQAANRAEHQYSTETPQEPDALPVKADTLPPEPEPPSAPSPQTTAPIQHDVLPEAPPPPQPAPNPSHARIPWLSASAEADYRRAADAAALSRRESPFPLAPRFSPVPSDVQSSAADTRITYLLIAIIVVLLVVAVGIYSWLGLSSTVLGTASDEIGAIDALAAATIERSTPSPTSSNPARNKVNKSRNQRSTSRHDAPQKSRLSAEELFRQAAVQNDPAAQYELGMAYADGTGRQKDIVSAYVWLVLARANGDLRSEPVLRSLVPNLTRSQVAAIRVALANMYTRGVGVAPDKVKAYTWLNLAEAAGSTEAAALKKELEPSLSSRKIASANSRSQQLLSHP